MKRRMLVAELKITLRSKRFIDAKTRVALYNYSVEWFCVIARTCRSIVVIHLWMPTSRIARKRKRKRFRTRAKNENKNKKWPTSDLRGGPKTWLFSKSL